VPTRVVYLAMPPRPNVAAAVASAAEDFGWLYEAVQDTSPEAVRAVLQAGANVIVTEGAALSEAREFPETYFVSVNPGEVPADLPGNALVIGGPGSRQDQAGFMAGVIAGFATETRHVAVIGDPASVEGRKHRNGFLHGVRYACPRCRVDFIDVPNVNESAAALQAVIIHVSTGFDVFFAAAGQAGNDALAAAAQRGAWVIGSGGDAYGDLFGGGSTPGADRVLTSVYLDPGEAVRAALAAFHAGSPVYGVQPFSAANGAIALAPYRDPEGALSLPDLADIAATLARLADGSLETGVDPLTGDEL
jgi:basic membrane lipoprotein Med (substrate-binding protein (PBP1-ABC) superfamily)